MNNIVFEEMKPEYLPRVLEIYNYYIKNSTATFHIKTFTTDEMKELVFFDNKRYKAFAAFCDGILCGYVALTPFKKREAYDRTGEIAIYLDKDYCGKNIGSILLKHIEDYAKTTDVKVLLSEITGSNVSSIKLFEKNGYEKCAHYKEVGVKFGELLDMVALQKMI